MAQAHPAAEKTRAAKSGDSFLPDYGAFAGQQAFQAWMQSGETLMKGAFDLTRHCMEFGQARLHEDFKVWEKLMGCKDFGQVADCQQSFAEKATRQYMDQFNDVTRRLSDIITGPAGAKEPVIPPPMPE